MKKNVSSKSVSSDGMIIFIICLIGLMSQFATDSFTPSLPHIAEYFNVSTVVIKRTVGVYFLGMSGSILIFGYLSDKYGRKKILIVGHIIFAISSLLCMLAKTDNQLIVFRLLQGVGMGSSFVSFRAIMKDVFSDNEALARASLIISSIVSFTPPLAPITGGFIQDYLGWRYNFTLHSILSIVIMFFIFKYLHLENIPKISNKWLDSYREILRNKIFILNAICSGLALSLVFVFVTLAPFLFQKKKG